MNKAKEKLLERHLYPDGSRDTTAPRQFPPSLLDSNVTKRNEALKLIYKAQEKFDTSPTYKQTNIKIIKINNLIQYYRYEFPLTIRIKEIKKRKPFEDPFKRKTKRSKEYRKRTAVRATNNLIRLVQGNFGDNPHTKFLTLTLNDHNSFDITNVEVCHDKMGAFLKAMRKQYGKFKYVWVVEFQKRGAVHYHLVVDFPFLDKETIAQYWGFGFIKIERVYTLDHVGQYLAKYMIKNALDKRLVGHRSYATSRNLDRPKIYYSDEAEYILDELGAHGIESTFNSKFVSKRNGQVYFFEYNGYHNPPAGKSDAHDE